MATHLTIDLYCNDGSPLGLIPPDVYGRGVGGAELAMISWAETMARRGHTVRVYNNPTNPGDYDGVEYLRQVDFEPDAKRDVFVIYRSPNPFVRAAKAEVKLHWSCDQYTVGDFGRDIFPFVDKVITISPYHTNYHRQRYGVENGKVGHIDLGVRLDDYRQKTKRIPGRCIFCSVPDRGLEVLRTLWPRIKKRVPEASLVITSDYRLWGVGAPMNYQYRMAWLHEPDVIYLGKIERLKLTCEQAMAEVLAYPCTYEELFCISAAECQVAGAVPVTSGIGALATTNQWGRVLDGNMMSYEWREQFVEAVVEAMTLDDTARAAMQKKAARRFSWDRICKQWENLINNEQ